MKAITKYTDSGPVFRLVEAATPIIQKPDDVLIKISSVGVCTSDIHVLHGAMQMPDGNIVGHEFSGEVVALGAAAGKHLAVGDRVVAELAKGACMKCRMCTSGHYELCPQKQPPGWKSQGVYAQYTVQPAFCVHKLPAGIDMGVAAMAEPIAICVYGCLERGRVSPDDFVVIYGMGSIGLFTLITLLDQGVRNILCIASTRGGRQRYDLAAELGAAKVLTPEDDIAAAVLQMNDGWKADCVIDCSGSPDAINAGIGLTRKGGKFIALGIASEDRIPFVFNQAVLNVLEVIFSATSSHQAWQTTMGILQRNEKKIQKVITHRLPLTQWRSAYDMLTSRTAVKAVLEPNG